MEVKLTQYSTSGGCGCKVPYNLLSDIIKTIKPPVNKDIISDYRNSEDAAIVKINDKQCMVYTLDFFFFFLDDPEMFGRIAAANAISDVYAKGAQPFLALSILGFPKELDHSDIPSKIVKGASELCSELNISIIGGHTIYNPQIIFGLSVTGMADISQLKLNSAAKPGDLIYLTKPIGTGIMSTALKLDSLDSEDEKAMMKHFALPNKIGALLGKYDFINCMTDITGFGLLGHLAEVCDASKVSAKLDFSSIKTLPNLDEYIEMGILTKGGKTNWDNYKCYVNGIDEKTAIVLADPQSNGGLLITVESRHREEFEEILRQNDLAEFASPIGEITERNELTVDITH